VFSVCVCVCIFLCLCTGRRVCDELITRPRNFIDCLSSRKPKWNGEFHGGRPRPKLEM
jgi:hypothetical protein